MRSALFAACACCVLSLLPGAATAQAAPLPVDPSVTVRAQLGATGMIAVDAGGQRPVLIDLDNAVALKLPGQGIEPAFSPDGQRLVMTASYGGVSRIWTGPWDGSALVAASAGDSPAGDGTWSPDGQEIWYSKEIWPGRTELFKVALNDVLSVAGVPVQMTHFGGRNTKPHVSPGGKLVAFSTDRFWPGWDVCVLNAETKRETCLGDSRNSFCRASWSPDGKYLAYSFGLGLQIDLELLTWQNNARLQLTDLPAKEYDVAWSPDGRYLAFVNNPSGDELYRLRIMRLSDKAQAVVASSSQSLRAPSWTGSKQYELGLEDSCPADMWKSSPGICGCGNPDLDSDADGALDCEEACPLDRAKQASGACGCSVADFDGDGDGTADCNDGCPADSAKTAAGICGCGRAEPQTPEEAALCTLNPALPSPTPTSTPLPRSAPRITVRHLSQRLTKLRIQLPRARKEFFTVRIRDGSHTRRYPKVSGGLSVRVARNRKLIISFHRNNTNGRRRWSAPLVVFS